MTLPAAALTAAFASLPVGMAVIGDDGRIVVMNEALEAICGVERGVPRPTRAGELAGDGEILYRVDRFLTPEDVRRGA
ncbi:MAG: PAS domain-containing protein [Miltoncostaeaceae bacterium]